jgi:hypothetical protein
MMMAFRCFMYAGVAGFLVALAAPTSAAPMVMANQTAGVIAARLPIQSVAALARSFIDRAVVQTKVIVERTRTSPRRR